MYQICQYAINKSQNGYLKPDQFNLLVKQAQDSYAAFIIGEFQQYQYNSAKSRISYSENEPIRQRLQPFIYNFNLKVDATGFAPYPGDYMQTDTMMTLYGYKRIKYVMQDRLWSYYNSKIDPIATNPIYLIEDKGFRFFPQNISDAQMAYIKNPNRIYWAYTYDVKGRPVYDAANSEQPKWGRLDILEIIARILKLVGISLQIGQVEQYAKEITNTGQ